MKGKAQRPKSKRGHPESRRPKWEGKELALIAIGSNMGNRSRQVREAMRRLATLSDEPLLRSSLWESTPVECPPGSPPFINAAVGLVPRASETPESLLGKLQELEREFGRRPKQVLNEPRPLDLDLIAFGGETRRTSALTLPHPRAYQRAFVLGPLREIAPGFILPGQTATISQLLEGMSPGAKIIRKWRAASASGRPSPDSSSPCAP